MTTIDLAVVLAAGLGSRLGSRNEHQPKGFLEVAGRSLIERSLDKLAAAGIREVIIGTGYHAEHYERLAAERGNITCRRSDRFATTGSMYTLYNLRPVVDRDFLLLESDLLFEARALALLQAHPGPDAVLASGFTDSRDEVFIETRGDELWDMSKDRAKLGPPRGELVGISRVSVPLFHGMCDVMAASLESRPKLDYEHAMVALAQAGRRIPVLHAPDLVWCEIDDEGQLARALASVLPAIEARDAAAR